jgi:hypothetical protein
MKIVGIFLIVLGVIGLLYGGLTWKKPETVVDVGPVKVTHDKTESLPVPPIAGGVLLAAGALILMSGSRRHA